MSVRHLAITDAQLHLLEAACLHAEKTFEPSVLAGPSSEVYADTLGEELNILASVFKSIRESHPSSTMLYGVAL